VSSPKNHNYFGGEGLFAAVHKTPRRRNPEKIARDCKKQSRLIFILVAEYNAAFSKYQLIYWALYRLYLTRYPRRTAGFKKHVGIQ
jgi:hypothetical protein